MAEILIRVRDKEGHNPMCVGEHEVVVICANNWPWTIRERSDPDWRIVRVGCSVSEAQRYVGKENVDPEVYLIRRRHFKLDPTQLTPNDQEWYADDTRKAAIRVIPAARWDAAFRERVPMRRPDVIGESRIKDIG